MAAVVSCPLQNVIKENRAVVSGSGLDVVLHQICLCHPGSSLAAAQTSVDGILGVLISCSRVLLFPPLPSFPNNTVSSLRCPLGVMFPTAPNLLPMWDEHLPSSLAAATMVALLDRVTQELSPVQLLLTLPSLNITHKGRFPEAGWGRTGWFLSGQDWGEVSLTLVAISRGRSIFSQQQPERILAASLHSSSLEDAESPLTGVLRGSLGADTPFPCEAVSYINWYFNTSQTLGSQKLLRKNSASRSCAVLSLSFR